VFAVKPLKETRFFAKFDMCWCAHKSSIKHSRQAAS